jgi:molybdate transport system substrate-binding protein
MRLFFHLGLIGLLVFATRVFAVDYRIYSAAGIKVPLIELSQLFNQNQTTYQILNNFDTAGAAEKKFFEDSQSACVITTQVRIDNALKSGRLQNQAQIPLVDTLAGLASSAVKKPNIKTAQDLMNALLAAKSIAFSDPARGATVGRHFEEVIKKLDIEKPVLQKAILASDGVETMKLVVEKKVELGITQMSEVIQADRNTLIGPFPSEFELATRYSLYCKNPNDEGLAPFIGLLKSSYGAKVFEYYGLRAVP